MAEERPEGAPEGRSPVDAARAMESALRLGRDKRLLKYREYGVDEERELGLIIITERGVLRDLRVCLIGDDKQRPDPAQDLGRIRMVGAKRVDTAQDFGVVEVGFVVPRVIYEDWPA